MSEESDFTGFKKITIIGCGLIGGSIGLALKKNSYSGEIAGIDRIGPFDRLGGPGRQRGIDELLGHLVWTVSNRTASPCQAGEGVLVARGFSVSVGFRRTGGIG